MPENSKLKDNQAIPPRRCGRRLATGKVVNATLDSSRGINNRCFVIVSLNDGARIDFPVPTTQEIRDRFFYKKAKTRPGVAARPPNKFFIFRTMFQGAIDDFKLQVPIVSGLASEVWKKCSPEVIDLFTKLSHIAKTEHGEINPGYVYKPNRSKSRIMKNKANSHIQDKSYPDYPSSSPTLNDLSLSPTAPLWTTPSSYFDPQEHVHRIPSQTNLQPDENLYATTQNFQSISSNFTYLTTMSPSIHDMTSPLETIHDPCQQHIYQYPSPTNALYYSNNECSMDQLISEPNTCYDQDVNNVLMQPQTTISYQSVAPYFSTVSHMNDNYDGRFNNNIFGGSPIFEGGKDVSEPTNMTPFCVEPIQEPDCIDYHFTILQNFGRN